MNYAVHWEPQSLSNLATLWIRAGPQRQAVTAAQVRIDELLGNDPLGNSSPLSEGLYAIEVHPLRAVFEVDETARLVRVLTVNWLP
jgi:hypothetical protein